MRFEQKDGAGAEPRAKHLLAVVTAAWIGCFLWLGLASRLPAIPWLTGRGESVAAGGHLVASFILAALLYALGRAWSMLGPGAVAASAAVTASAVGGAIELLQGFTRSRTPTAGDWGLDIIGAVAGALAIMAFDGEGGRGRLPQVGTLLGAASAALVVVAAVIWPAPATSEVTSFCPPDVEERQVPRGELPTGSAGRAGRLPLALYQFEGDGSDSAGDPTLHLELLGGASVEDGALRIDRVDGRAVSPGPAAAISDAIAESEAFSFEAWARPDDLLQRGPARVVTMSGSTSLNDVSFHLGQERTCLSVRLAATGGEAEWWLVDGVFVDARPVWHLVVTYRAGAVTVYVNGGPVFELVVADPDDGLVWDRSHPLIVGNELSADRAFRGDIHLVAIYDAALTADEVAANYAAGP